MRFALIEANPKKLRVYFWPGWAPSDGASTDDVYIECNASSEALRTACSVATSAVAAVSYTSRGR